MPTSLLCPTQGRHWDVSASLHATCSAADGAAYLLLGHRRWSAPQHNRGSCRASQTLHGTIYVHKMEKTARCNMTQVTAVLQVWKGFVRLLLQRILYGSQWHRKRLKCACASEPVRDCRGWRTETMWVGTRTRPAFWATARSCGTEGTAGSTWAWILPSSCEVREALKRQPHGRKLHISRSCRA